MSELLIRPGMSGTYHQTPGDVSIGFDGYTECAALILGVNKCEACQGSGKTATENMCPICQGSGVDGTYNLAVFGHLPEQIAVISRKAVTIGTGQGQLELPNYMLRI